jgi:hypothetical protein
MLASKRMIGSDGTRRSLPCARRTVWQPHQKLSIPTSGAVKSFLAIRNIFFSVALSNLFNMFAHKSVLSLVLPFLINQALGQSGIQLDVNSQGKSALRNSCSVTKLCQTLSSLQRSH